MYSLIWCRWTEWSNSNWVVRFTFSTYWTIHYYTDAASSNLSITILKNKVLTHSSYKQPGEPVSGCLRWLYPSIHIMGTKVQYLETEFLQISDTGSTHTTSNRSGEGKSKLIQINPQWMLQSSHHRFLLVLKIQDPAQTTNIFMIGRIQQYEEWRGVEGHRYIQQTWKFWWGHTSSSQDS
jgi:hypothetical protein